jgi:hypothetical protein
MADYNVEEFYQKVMERIPPDAKLLKMEMVGLDDVTESVLNLNWEKKDVRKKVFAVYVELIQNVIHHSAQLTGFNQQSGTGVVVVIEKKDSYEIISANIIENGKVQNLINRCEEINRLDPGGLKILYSDRRKQPVPSRAKGSGLGLIDIARKSGNPINIKVDKINEKVSLLELSATINKDA